MLPLVLDPETLRVGLAGGGAAFDRRLALLTESGFGRPALFRATAPSGEDLRGLHVLFVAGLDSDASAALSAAARAAGVLVNVEDRPELCDFHVPAIVRRGDLLLTVSTGGRSPGAARILRAQLEKLFGPEWGDRLDEIAAARASWRASGMPPQDVAERTGALVENKGWLS